MFLKMLNNFMVGFANIFSRGILGHIFLSYGSITYAYLEKNFENICKAWDPHKPVETLFNQIPDCVEFS